MVGGTIENIETIKGIQRRITVKGTGCEENDLIDVKVLIVDSALKLIENGKAIWWDSNCAYISIFDVQDVRFARIGPSFNHRHIGQNGHK